MRVQPRYPHNKIKMRVRPSMLKFEPIDIVKQPLIDIQSSIP